MKAYMQIFADGSLIDESDSGRRGIFGFALVNVPEFFCVVLEGHMQNTK